MSAQVKREARKRRQARVRKSVKGTSERPRLCVFRSLKYTYVQLISDEDGSVLGSVSSKAIETEGASRGSVDTAKLVGKKIAEVAKEKKISRGVFDRNGYLYHGRVAAVAEGAREGGLEF